MKHFLLIILFVNITITYAQSSLYIGVDDFAPTKRLTPYKTKPAAATAQAAEKTRIAKMEKELQEADTAFEKEEYNQAYTIYTKYESDLDGEQYYRLGRKYAIGNATDKNLEKAKMYFEKGAS